MSLGRISKVQLSSHENWKDGMIITQVVAIATEFCQSSCKLQPLQIMIAGGVKGWSY